MAELLDYAKGFVWTGQASVKIPAGNILIWVDPFNIPENKAVAVDVILISHSHSDHFSPGDIKRVYQAGKTVIIGPEDVISSLPKELSSATMVLKPGETYNLESAEIKAVPAYNVVKASYHPKNALWLGYLIEVDTVSIYHTGDTERIPEMASLNCDIMLLPLGQTYTMNSVDEAVQSALDCKAMVAIPIHYGIYEGSNRDAQQFADAFERNKDVTAYLIPKQ